MVSSRTAEKLSAMRRFVHRHNDQWKKQFGPNLLGAHVGRKIVDGQEQRRYSIVFRVLDKQRFPEDGTLPRYFKVPANGKEGIYLVPTDVVQTERFRAHSLIPGSSTRDRNYPTEWGTVSFFCKLGDKLCACSNAHVLARSYMAAGGYGPTNTPGAEVIELEWEGYKTKGRLVRAVHGPVDAAIAWIRNTEPISFNIPGIGLLSGIMGPLNDRWNKRAVRMYGRRSHNLAGSIVDWNIPDETMEHGAVMKNMMLLKWNNGATVGGDSGAPIVDEGNRLIGILVGGDGTYSIAFPILDIIKPEHLNVRVLHANQPT